MELYDVEEIAVAAKGVTHYVVTTTPGSEDAQWWARRFAPSRRIDDPDGRPLCGTPGDPRGPRVGARLCRVCEFELDDLELSVKTARRRVAESNAMQSAEFDRLVDEHEKRIAW